MTALILNFLRPYLMQIAIGGGIALAAGGAFVGWSVHQYNKGYAHAVADVAADNKEAVDAVNEHRSVVRDCQRTVGMRWDQVARECVRRD